MTFQAYLDAVELKTQKTPSQLLEQAQSKGFNKDTKAGEVIAWLKDEYGLGRGHAMAIVHIIKHGAEISSTHVCSGGVHSDDSNVLRLDGIKNR